MSYYKIKSNSPSESVETKVKALTGNLRTEKCPCCHEHFRSNGLCPQDI